MPICAAVMALALAIAPAHVSRVALARAPASSMRMMAQPAEIQFLKGVDEMVVPDIKLTRSIDGMTGTATFIFDQPNFLQASSEPQGEITGMYMIDEEGEIATTDVNAKFLNGKPRIVEAVFIMRDPPTFDRVMRFLERYAESHGLAFNSA